MAPCPFFRKAFPALRQNICTSPLPPKTTLLYAQVVYFASTRSLLSTWTPAYKRVFHSTLYKTPSSLAAQYQHVHGRIPMVAPRRRFDFRSGPTSEASKHRRIWPTVPPTGTLLVLRQPWSWPSVSSHIDSCQCFVCRGVACAKLSFDFHRQNQSLQHRAPSDMDLAYIVDVPIPTRGTAEAELQAATRC